MDKVRKIDAPNEAVKQYREYEELLSISRTICVPTNDDEVRRTLRLYGEAAEQSPFESRTERRERLTTFLAKRKRDQQEITEDREPESKFIPAYIANGPTELFEARKRIFESVSTYRSQRKAVEESKSKHLELYASQSGFKRAVSDVKFYDKSRVLITDWSGALSRLTLDDNMSLDLLKSWESPLTCLSVSKSQLVAVGSSNGDIEILRTEGQILELASLSGHTNRVSGLESHPQLDYLLSTSYDSTWRLWDLTSQNALLTQDGHTDFVSDIKVNAEGSLAATSSFDKTVKVWDLRSGINVVSCQEHLREVYSVAWKSDIEFASAGNDNRCLIWDLRSYKEPFKCLYADKNAISGLCFMPKTLVTASQDGVVKLWNTDSWVMEEKLLLGSKIMGLDVNQDNLVVGKWDRQADWCRPLE